MSKGVRLRYTSMVVVLGVLAGAGSTCSAPSKGLTAQDPADKAIPELSTWQSQMITYGRKVCTTIATPPRTALRAPTEDERLGHTYYDLTRVMYQIADYTRDPRWNACAAQARTIFLDAYVLPHKYGVAGWWHFSTGLRLDFERTGHARSKTAVVEIAKVGWAADTTPPEWSQASSLSREVAYAIVSHIDAEALGEPRRARRAQLVDQAYDHLDQWFVQLTWRADPKQALAPFMVGLTAHSLIRDWEQTKDPRLIPALRRAADWMWANAWLRREEAMWYATDDRTPAPDLNLLVAPIYAFLYRHTGLSQYRDQGDALFAGGVRGAWLDGGKQFNQNYWWSVDYVKWRSLAR